MLRLAPISRLPIVAALCACAAGCGAEASQSDVTLEVDTWWGDGSERDAFNKVTELFEADHPGISIRNMDKATAADARARAASQLLVGLPPSSFQANIGADLLRWAVYVTEDAATEESHILPLTTLLEGVPVRKPLMDALTFGPEHPAPFGVPIGIHRINVLYYNVDWFQHYTGPPLTEFKTLCPDDPTTAVPLPATIAVATGDNSRYTLGHLAFENILVGISPDSYRNLFTGKPTDADWTNVRHALACVQYLSQSFADSSDTWAAAIDRLSEGTADFAVMGDWANGQLADALKANVVDSMPFPGTEATYVFTADTFPLPIGAPHPKETEDFLRAISEPALQDAFSRLKGSIPARSDAAEQFGDADIKRRSLEFDQSTPLLATSGLFPPYYPETELYDALFRMTDLTDPPDLNVASERLDFVEALLQEAEQSLITWQGRLAGGAAAPVQP